MTTILSDRKCSGDPNRISYGKRAGDGFQYVLKHGTGPGTLPKNVGIIREVCLSNFITVVYLDRVLGADEMEKFDIPNECKNKQYIGDVEL